MMVHKTNRHVIYIVLLISFGELILAMSLKAQGGMVIDRAQTPTPVKRSEKTSLQPPYEVSRNFSDIEHLTSRIAALEAGRQDLSAWATLLIGIISVVLAANVGLSVWQVSSLTQKEVDRVRSRYDKQFSGFLTRSQEGLAAKIAEYEASVADLSHSLENLTLTLQTYIEDTTHAIQTVGKDSERALERLHAEAEIIRTEIRNAFDES